MGQMIPCGVCGTFARVGSPCPHCASSTTAHRSLAVVVLLGLSSCGLLTGNQNADYGSPMSDTDWTDIDTDTDIDTGETGGSGGS